MKKDVSVRLGHLRCALLIVIAGAAFCLSVAPARAADAAPCAANSPSRQMDFWVGDWTVTYPGMRGTAASQVSLALDHCLLIESWDGGKEHSGKNMFAYSSDDKHWHGMFADNQGRVHVFEGKASPDSAEFVGPSVNAKGEPVLNRIRIVRIGADKVEQSWEKSSDHGATWRMEFRGEYSRKTR